MPSTKMLRFTKMHGAGNDYLYVDCISQPPPADPSALARAMSHRHFGVGADGIILIRPSEKADARMQMFNADGSEAEMCGNGIRCFAKYIYDHGIAPRDRLHVETGHGVLALDVVGKVQGKVNRIRVDMGEPILEAAKIPTRLPGDPVVNRELEVAGRRLQVTCVSMGNPHCVVFMDPANGLGLNDDLVLGVGPQIETHPLFPARVNVEFVEVLGRGEVRQRTWERGSGETWACGTGASAVCVAGVLTGRTERRLLNHLIGGDLELDWDARTNHVLMTGPAVEVCTGEWPLD
ncbi:MAG: diaminopimelate epimerase [Pirellulaceae bacterium]